MWHKNFFLQYSLESFSNDQSSLSTNKKYYIDATNGDEDIEYRSSDDEADENEEAESSSDNDSDDEEMSLDEINLDNITPSTGNTLLNVYYLVDDVRQFVR
ncbi:unnamed protein product, partial [Rotaria sordida]